MLYGFNKLARQEIKTLISLEFSKASNEDMDDGGEKKLFFISDSNFHLSFPTADHFYSKVAAEAPGRKIQFRWARRG